jgi:Spy/CpxP family protein refolding chaperone
MYTAEHVKGEMRMCEEGASACALYVGGESKLENATNMETTEQRFTQIRAELKKRNKSQEERARATVKEIITGNRNEQNKSQIKHKQTPQKRCRGKV